MVDIEPDGADLTVGRSARATVTVRGDRVSRVHVTLRWSHGRLLLSDNQSTNGTALNGRPVEPGVEVPVASGDEITFGDVALLLGVTSPWAAYGPRVLPYCLLWRRLSQELVRSRRYHRPLGLAMIRIEGPVALPLERLIEGLDSLEVLAENGRGDLAILAPEAAPAAFRERICSLLDTVAALPDVDLFGGCAHPPGGAVDPNMILQEARQALAAALRDRRRLVWFGPTT